MPILGLEPQYFLGLREDLPKLLSELRNLFPEYTKGATGIRSCQIRQCNGLWEVLSGPYHTYNVSSCTVTVWTFYCSSTKKSYGSGIIVANPKIFREIKISADGQHGWEHCLVSWMAGLSEEYSIRVKKSCIILS